MPSYFSSTNGSERFLNGRPYGGSVKYSRSLFFGWNTKSFGLLKCCMLYDATVSTIEIGIVELLIILLVGCN